MHRGVNEWLFDVGCGENDCIFYVSTLNIVLHKENNKDSAPRFLFRVEVKNGKSKDKFEIKNEQFVKFVKWSKQISWAQIISSAPMNGWSVIVH